MSTILDLPASFQYRLHESTTEGFDRASGGYFATGSWYGPWNERKQFLQVVGGLPETVTYPTGGTATRIVPLKYPAYPRCYADRAQLRGDGASRLGTSGEGIEYDWAIVTVDFKTFQYDMDGAYPLVTEELDGGSEFVTRPGSAYVFPSDSKKVNQDIGVHMPTTDFSLTFHNVPGPLTTRKALWQTLQGRVNTTTFYDYAPGTVQYVGVGTTTQYDTAGQYRYEVVHRFKFRWVPHNMIMRPDGAGFEAPVQVGAPTLFILPVADLNLIFS